MWTKSTHLFLVVSNRWLIIILNPWEWSVPVGVLPMWRLHNNHKSLVFVKNCGTDGLLKIWWVTVGKLDQKQDFVLFFISFFSKYLLLKSLSSSAEPDGSGGLIKPNFLDYKNGINGMNLM